MSQTLSLAAIRKLLEQWLAQGKRAAGPTRVGSGMILYAAVESPDQLLLDGFVHPGNSIKEFVLPPHEKLYGYVIKGREIELRDNDAPVPEVLILGRVPATRRRYRSWTTFSTGTTWMSPTSGGGRPRPS
jgi:hypothetical protein